MSAHHHMPTEPRLPASRAARFARACVDPLLALCLAGVYLAALLSSVKDLGYARDEGFYFHAARTYGGWFELLLSDPGEALRGPVIDQYWQVNHEHPSLMKSLFWASQRLLEGSLLEERGTSYRLPAMLLASLTVAVIFLWGRRVYGRAGGLVAALTFACIPHVFHHSHLACFDLPIVAFWLFVAYAYQRSFQTRRWSWGIACGLLYGLALETKHNAWFLPVAFGAHVLLWHVLQGRLFSRMGKWRTWYRLRVPSALPFLLLLGPLVFYALWPWIWQHTWARLQEYATFHLRHVYYNMEFLGQTYFTPPFPRTYAWLMTAATVPAITLCCAVLGASVGAYQYFWREGGWARLRAAPVAQQEGPLFSPVGGGVLHPGGDASLWLLCLLVAYGPWVLSSTPIFGGTKHWLTAYPFLALLAGRGFVWLSESLGQWLEQVGSGRLVRLRWLAQSALAACLLLAPAVMTWHAHPWGLSAYTPLVGGAPGAATLGLNRSFWGYTTGAIQDQVDQRAARRARVFVHDTALDSFAMMQQDGRLRSDLRPWRGVAGSSLALYHHEQHMSRVEHMIWVDYGTIRPAHIGAFDGVPVIWLYQRPQR
ncbi:MAG: hypothetical protein RL685_4838 [Pseudomonadota bacterium]